MKTLLLILALAFSVHTQGAEKIEGAFGLKLGDKFDPEKAIGTASLTDGTPMYEFNASSPYRAFKNYYVLITPTTKLIYCIWAQGTFESTPVAKKEQDVLRAILKEKYGEPKSKGLIDTLGDVDSIGNKDRYVVTKVSGFKDITLDIRYYDSALKTQAEEERVAEEAKKVDKSGL